MPASRDRPRWSQVPRQVRLDVERLAAGRIVAARNCPGGFSPGLASRLTCADGRRLFVKALDGDAWPGEAAMYRREALIAAALPVTVGAPRLFGTRDDGHWIILAFEDIDGAEPRQPWRRAEAERVVAALEHLAHALTPSPIPLPADHVRLGGWTELADDSTGPVRLAAQSAWAADNLASLIDLEQHGLAAARGHTLVHFDLYPHNVLLTPDRVVVVDWPHAQQGNQLVDLIQLLSSVAADGGDPEPLLPTSARSQIAAIDAILTAHTGFLIAGGLAEPPPGLEAIPQAKLRLGHGALRWLRRRLGHRPG